VVGTAGHVDHGKSSLVRALTGTDPDRLAEEKARGLTIDLGFAWTVLPDGTVASFIDVPGHEDFIRNALAGAGGIEAALLVVAADEGPMPQTLEHLAILDLLGVAHGVVALTKVDQVDADWRDLVVEEVAALVAGTTLAAAEIVAVSAVQGTGLPELVLALERALAGVPPARDVGRARLPVDRVFTLPGFGTVVTGTLRDGALAAGEPLEVLPSRLRVRARSIQSHGASVSAAGPGTRVALNLAGIETAAIARGDVVVAADAWRTTRLVDAQVDLLADAPGPLAHDRELSLFHGTAEITARVRVLGGDAIAPGASGPVQLRLARPAVLAAGDRFVLRQPSPSTTVGGGRILDPHPPLRRRRRFDPRVLARFAALASGDPLERAWHMLAEREPAPESALAPADLGLEPAARAQALAALQRVGRAIDLAGHGLWITDAGWEDLATVLRKVLADYHASHPLRAGPPPEEVRERLGLAAEPFGAVLDQAQREGWLVRTGAVPRLAEHAAAFTPDVQATVEQLLARFRQAPFGPPTLREAEADAGAAVVEALVARGDLVAVSADVAFDRAAYQALLDGTLAALDATGQVTVADLRDRFGSSRKYVLPFLEHLDRQRVTRRTGDVRVRAAIGRGAA